MSEKEQRIKESYWDPMMQFHPIIAYFIINFFFDQTIAIYGGLVVFAITTIRVLKTLPNVFRLYIFYSVLLLALITLVGVVGLFFDVERFEPLWLSIALLLLLLWMKLFPQQIAAISYKLVPTYVPMTSTLRLTLIFTNVLITGLSLYIVLFVICTYFAPEFIQPLRVIYIIGWIVLAVYSLLRVAFVRSQLRKDKWLPILNEKGETVETVLRIGSLSDKRKHTHPVVRGIILIDGQILLKKATKKALTFSELWDNAIDDHISIGIDAKDCLKQKTVQKYGIEVKKTSYLGHYIYNTPYENQYELVYLITEYSGTLVPNLDLIAQIRWMSTEHIEEQLNSGIFDERFVKEFEMLKGAGLLEVK